MTKFYYLKAKNSPDTFMGRILTELGWGLGPKPHLFTDRQAAFNAHEEFRMKTRAAGKPATLLQIHEIEL